MDTSVTVSTQVGSATVEVERLRRIGMTTTDTGDPLLFAIFEVAGLPPLGGQPFGADTRFGTIRGQLGRGRFVMVVAHIEVPPAVASPVADTSKWACYAIDGAPGGRFEMHWTDAFGNQQATFGRPSYVCLPDTASGATRSAVCFGQSRDADVVFPRVVNIATSIGPFGTPHDIQPLDEFCVQADNVVLN